MTRSAGPGEQGTGLTDDQPGGGAGRGQRQVEGAYGLRVSSSALGHRSALASGSDAGVDLLDGSG